MPKRIVAKSRVKLDGMRRRCGNFFLDSGAHSLYTIEVINKAHQNGYSYYRSREFWDYVDQYAWFLKANGEGIDHYANVDVIFHPRLSWRVLKYLENEHGLRPVPVLHYGTPMKWVDKHLDAGYKYLGIGGLGQEVSKAAYFHWADVLFDRLCPGPARLPVVKTHGFAMTSYELVIRYPWYCMTDDHEVLTKRGWVGREGLNPGDEILAYHHGKSESRWEKVQAVPAFDLKDEEIVRFSNRNMEAYTTKDHRWPVVDASGEPIWKKTRHLAKAERGRGYRIARSAPYHRDFPAKETYTDEVVELLAWYWTDGSRRKRPKYKTNSMSIYQSDKANPDKVAMIRQLLVRTGDGFCESRLKTKPHEVQFEAWGDTVQKVFSIAPGANKEFPLDFVLKLSKRQLKLFIHTTLQGDGGWDKRLKRKRSFVLPQKAGRNLEVFRVAAMLAGYSTSMFESQKQNMRTLRSSSVDHVYTNKLRKEVIKHTGKVWCVQVPSKAFFTRCKGHVYVTGNSVDSTSWAQLAGFGAIFVPHRRAGRFTFEDHPYMIATSYRSKANKQKGKHYNTLTSGERSVVNDWLDHIRVPLGKINPDGTVAEYGILSEYNARAIANLRFFEALCNRLPDWPWPFKARPRRGFFAWEDIRG